MIRYSLRRLGQGCIIVVGVLTLIFLVYHALPGSKDSILKGHRTDVSSREAMAQELGLYQPVHIQLLQYFNDLLPISTHLDTPQNQAKYRYLPMLRVNGKVMVLKWPYLRRSFQSNKPVSEMLGEHFWGTFWLSVVAMVLACGGGVLLGTTAALRQQTWADYLIGSFCAILLSIPSFVTAIFMAMIFGYYLSDITGLNVTGSLYATDTYSGTRLELKNILLPAITLCLHPLASITMLSRNSMLEVLGQDYIRTARAKGLRRRAILLNHALQNALNPIITSVGGWMGTLLAGSFFVEYVYHWKGIGLMTISAVQSMDFPVIMGATLLMALWYVVLNLASDVLYALNDPRIRWNN